MAQAELNIMFLTPNGLDGHLKLIPGEGESSMDLLKQAEGKLAAMGCKPRPQPGRGGGGNWGGKKAAEPAPGKACPKCRGPVTFKSGKRGDGSQYEGYACMKPKEQCGGWLKA